MIESLQIEDERGVDVSQIRRQLRLSVPERIAAMVATANTLMSIRHAAASSSDATRRA